mmetsp:Transcript_10699/g.11818  ORF Transcript_10699/g.11818 Transcript_10699/m.11818 type:complete len:119 (+) Transcript_10699:2-358(+)
MVYFVHWIRMIMTKEMMRMMKLIMMEKKSHGNCFRTHHYINFEYVLVYSSYTLSCFGKVFFIAMSEIYRDEDVIREVVYWCGEHYVSCFFQLFYYFILQYELYLYHNPINPNHAYINT